MTPGLANNPHFWVYTYSLVYKIIDLSRLFPMKAFSSSSKNLSMTLTSPRTLLPSAAKNQNQSQGLISDQNWTTLAGCRGSETSLWLPPSSKIHPKCLPRPLSSVFSKRKQIKIARRLQTTPPLTPFRWSSAGLILN